MLLDDLHHHHHHHYAAAAEDLLNSLRTSDTLTRLYLPFYVWAVQQVVFHATGLLFEYFDRTNAFPTSKVRHVNLDRKPYLSLLPRVLFNQFFILLPCMCLSALAGLCFSGPLEGEHLHPVRFLASLPAMALGHDVIQYLAHRYLLHQPNIHLMRFLKHSVHHSTGATRGISACYMAAPDFLLEIVGPYLIPLALVGGGGSDYFFHSLIAGMGAIGGIYEHSGYDFSIHFVDPADTITTADLLADYPVKPVAMASTSSSSSPAAATTAHAEPASPLSIRRLACLFLANFLDNRSHGEHHTRANVSFSDGFGSPSIMDTLLKTRWSDIPRPKRWRKSSRTPTAAGATDAKAAAYAAADANTEATINGASQRLAAEQEEAKAKRMREVEAEWQRLREEGRGGSSSSSRKTTSRSNSHDSNSSASTDTTTITTTSTSSRHSDDGASVASSNASDCDGLVTPPDHEQDLPRMIPVVASPSSSSSSSTRTSIDGGARPSPSLFAAVKSSPPSSMEPPANATATTALGNPSQLLKQRLVPAVVS